MCNPTCIRDYQNAQIMKFSFCRAVNDAIEGIEGKAYSFLSSSDVSDNSDNTIDSNDTFRYSQPEPD